MPSDPHLEGQTLICLLKICISIIGVTLILEFPVPYTLYYGGGEK